MKFANKLLTLLIIISTLTIFNIIGTIFYEYNITTGAATAEVALTISGTCGDDVCSDDESCSTCSADCGVCPAPEETPTTGGGGGGGGAAEEVSDTVSTPEVSHEESWSSLEEGQTALVTIDDEDIPITKLEIQVNQDTSEPWIKIHTKEKTELPSHIKVIETKVAHYLYVEKGPSIQNEIIDDIEIEFRVKKSWLVNNGLNINEISLYHFGDDSDSWEQLETFIVESTATYVIYSASVSGFSYFAIAEGTSTPKKEKIVDIIQEVLEPCKSLITCTDWEPVDCAIGQITQRTCYDVNGCTDSVEIESRYCGEEEIISVEEGILSKSFNLAGNAWSFGRGKIGSAVWVVVFLLLIAIIAPIIIHKSNKTITAEYYLSNLHTEIDGAKVQIKLIIGTNEKGKNAAIIEKIDLGTEDSALENILAKV